MEHYIPRNLQYIEEGGEAVLIDEQAFAEIQVPVVVLGEPGMGKSWFLQRICEVHGYTLRSASVFVSHPNPQALLGSAGKVVIDGLDELGAAHEADPVVRVLSKLIEAGCPPFVLSCRSAEWRGAIARQNISEEYGRPPVEASLVPLDKRDAVKFLTPFLGDRRAAEVIDYLIDRGIPDLFGNPLTLKLFGTVAESKKGELPRTRAGLLDAACNELWREFNDRHGHSPLAALNRDAALDAAGAACAALLLTGNATVSTLPSKATSPGVMPLSELTLLPETQQLSAVLKGRLFVTASDDGGLSKPMHRSIAEYLGGRWLGRRAKSDEAVDRILNLLTYDRGVPASLRGLHAWLPHFNPAFSTGVIRTDPYGLLRYGDADDLTLAQARLLLAELTKLQDDDPYFRAEDWGRHSAKGLARIELRDELKELIFSTSTTFHLRTLLLEALKGTPVAEKLKEDLFEVVRNRGEHPFGYSERADAVDALAAMKSASVVWEDIVRDLSKNDDEDDTRLAVAILDEVGYEHFSPEAVALSVLGCSGLLEGQSERRSVAGTLYYLPYRLPDEQLEAVLDSLARLQIRQRDEIDFMSRSELIRLVDVLIARRIALSDPEPEKILSWINIVFDRYREDTDERKALSAYFKNKTEARRAIQRAALFKSIGDFWHNLHELASASAALNLTTDDVIHFLGDIGRLEESEDAKLDRWRELASYARRDPERSAEILNAAQSFAAKHPEAAEILERLRAPPEPPAWEEEYKRKERIRRANKQKKWQQNRKDFSAHRAELEAGELRWILPIAHAYLGMLYDMKEEGSGPDRVEAWLGESLRESSLVGLEAVLHRIDLPSTRQVAESYAESRRWNFIYPIIAAVAERERTGRGIEDLAVLLVQTALIGLEHEHLRDRAGVPELASKLKAHLRTVPSAYEAFVRLYIEPQLATGKEHVTGLYALMRSDEDRYLIHRLAKEWVAKYPDMHITSYEELIDKLAQEDERPFLIQEIKTRFDDLASASADDRRSSYCVAIGLLVAFDDWRELAERNFMRREFLWRVARVFGGSRFSEDRHYPAVEARQLGWIIEHFSKLFPRQDRPGGVTSGSDNPWDATDVLDALIRRLGAITGDAATAELDRLRTVVRDDYLASLKHAAADQRRARRELAFPAISLSALKGVLEGGPPQSASDLLVVLKASLAILQGQLRGNDTDIIEKYFTDDGYPRDEDTCTDRLIEDLERILPKDIQRVPQRDMPDDKRVDIEFVSGEAVLPVECKSQWNRDLWNNAVEQLDAFYLRDWRTENIGLYLVYWFGPDVPAPKRPKAGPGQEKASSAVQLKDQLLARMPPERRTSIAIEVLDFSRSAAPI